MNALSEHLTVDEQRMRACQTMLKSAGCCGELVILWNASAKPQRRMRGAPSVILDARPATRFVTLCCHPAGHSGDHESLFEISDAAPA